MYVHQARNRIPDPAQVRDNSFAQSIAIELGRVKFSINQGNIAYNASRWQDAITQYQEAVGALQNIQKKLGTRAVRLPSAEVVTSRSITNQIAGLKLLIGYGYEVQCRYDIALNLYREIIATPGVDRVNIDPAIARRDGVTSTLRGMVQLIFDSLANMQSLNDTVNISNAKIYIAQIKRYLAILNESLPQLAYEEARIAWAECSAHTINTANNLLSPNTLKLAAADHTHEDLQRQIAVCLAKFPKVGHDRFLTLQERALRTQLDALLENVAAQAFIEKERREHIERQLAVNTLLGNAYVDFLQHKYTAVTDTLLKCLQEVKGSNGVRAINPEYLKDPDNGTVVVEYISVQNLNDSIDELRKNTLQINDSSLDNMAAGIISRAVAFKCHEQNFNPKHGLYGPQQKLVATELMRLLKEHKEFLFSLPETQRYIVIGRLLGFLYDNMQVLSLWQKFTHFTRADVKLTTSQANVEYEFAEIIRRARKEFTAYIAPTLDLPVFPGLAVEIKQKRNEKFEKRHKEMQHLVEHRLKDLPVAPPVFAYKIIKGLLSEFENSGYQPPAVLQEQAHKLDARVNFVVALITEAIDEKCRKLGIKDIFASSRLKYDQERLQNELITILEPVWDKFPDNKIPADLRNELIHITQRGLKANYLLQRLFYCTAPNICFTDIIATEKEFKAAVDQAVLLSWVGVTNAQGCTFL